MEAIFRASYLRHIWARVGKCAAARHNRSMSRSGGLGGDGRVRVLIVGCTGSIGTLALEFIAANTDRF